ncbi:hypothetical protein BDZ45DRAFT_811895 [Acephala macrosclerotiorum]|nr:hypothetical protein BDZ45DRAFT_811895 [Acephala macrosclerotiorum]
MDPWVRRGWIPLLLSSSFAQFRAWHRRNTIKHSWNDDKPYVELTDTFEEILVTIHRTRYREGHEVIKEFMLVANEVKRTLDENSDGT